MFNSKNTWVRRDVIYTTVEVKHVAIQQLRTQSLQLSKSTSSIIYTGTGSLNVHKPHSVSGMVNNYYKSVTYHDFSHIFIFRCELNKRS